MLKTELIKNKSALEEILNEAILFDKATLGNIQLFNFKNGSLTIVAQKGFQKDFLEHFKVVNAFDTSACGRAIGLKSRVVIQDINQDIAYSAHKKIAQSAGYRGVKSTPVYTEDNLLLGLISTHFSKPNIVPAHSYSIELTKSISLCLQQLSGHKSFHNE